MREWQQDLVMYRITPAPPKMELQEYIELYCKEKDEKYFLWFLHYYENTLNTKVMGWVQNYAMPGHFQDMKQAFIIGMWKALQEYDLSRDIPFVKIKENTAKREIHEYIRKMRRGFTVQSFDEDLRLRKAMRLFYENEEKTDDETMEKIFIWDEFSEYFENNMHHLTGFQQIAELSATTPFCLMIVTHKAEGYFSDGDPDKRKILDRFVPPIHISLPENIAFELMAQAMKVTDDEDLAAKWVKNKGSLDKRTMQSRAAVKNKINLTDKHSR